jgi:hypothetical protein
MVLLHVFTLTLSLLTSSLFTLTLSFTIQSFMDVWIWNNHVQISCLQVRARSMYVEMHEPAICKVRNYCMFVSLAMQGSYPGPTSVACRPDALRTLPGNCPRSFCVLWCLQARSTGQRLYRAGTFGTFSFRGLRFCRQALSCAHLLVKL